MKVLLINPEFPDTYWSFRHALPFEGKRCSFPPLGLLTVSALLPATWERKLVDLNIESLKTADIEWADMVFATAMLVQKDSLRQVVRRCKTLGKRVVLGGPYVTTTIEDLPDADHVFLGEAVMRLLADLHQSGATVCMVTHDPRFADHATRVIHVLDGRVVDRATALAMHTASMETSVS